MAWQAETKKYWNYAIRFGLQCPFSCACNVWDHNEVMHTRFEMRWVQVKAFVRGLSTCYMWSIKYLLLLKECHVLLPGELSLIHVICLLNNLQALSICTGAYCTTENQEPNLLNWLLFLPHPCIQCYVFEKREYCDSICLQYHHASWKKNAKLLSIAQLAEFMWGAELLIPHLIAIAMGIPACCRIHLTSGQQLQVCWWFLVVLEAL